MAIEVFNRYEKKFIISDEVYRLIKPQLEEHMEVDAHSPTGDFYTICNLYYDTADNEIIRKSIEKPAYKEKLRLSFSKYGTEYRQMILHKDTKSIKSEYKQICV